MIRDAVYFVMCLSVGTALVPVALFAFVVYVFYGLWHWASRS